MSAQTTPHLIRGRILTFLENPSQEDAASAYRFYEDGALLIANGKIADIGDFADVQARASAHEGGDIAVTDHRPHLIMPGFIDTHLHFPQTQAIASYGAQLLEWLNTYVFVEEQKFENAAHADFIAGRFLDELIRNGTTTAVAYCSVHKQSAQSMFAAARQRNMLMVGGKVMMDRNAPEALRDTPQSGYDDSKALIEVWHKPDQRNYYAISPRFAITSTPEQLEMSKALVQEFPDCYVQTHLSENRDEIAFATSLYPAAKYYIDIYAHYKLLTPKTILGHCIHMCDREVSLMAERGSVAAFCPTSNLFLGSGLFDHDRFAKLGARISVATDVGGGSSFSMLETMSEAYKIMALQGQKLSPLQSYYMLTLGNARALGLQDKIGSLHMGADADIVVLDARAKPAMDLRMDVAETLEDELFILQTMGDDRCVRDVYIAGKAMKSAL